MSDWFMFNDMLLNPAKSKAMIVGSKCQAGRAGGEQITVAGTSVNVCDKVKIVGLTIDSDLSFSNPISDVVKKTAIFT